MDRTTDVRAEIGNLNRVQQNVLAIAKKANDQNQYGVDLSRLYPEIAFGFEAEFPDFMTNYDVVVFYIEHLTQHVIDPQWRVPWTVGQFRRQSGVWVQSFWAMPTGRAKIEGRAESVQYMNAIHAACLRFTANVIEHRIIDRMAALGRQEAREKDKAASAAFEEHLRLANETIAATERRRAMLADQDRDWDRAAPAVRSRELV